MARERAVGARQQSERTWREWREADPATALARALAALDE